MEEEEEETEATPQKMMWLKNRRATTWHVYRCSIRRDSSGVVMAKAIVVGPPHPWCTAWWTPK